MESDAYSLFTESHRIYIQGVRRSIQERLSAAYGDDWFRRGVIPAVTPRQQENIQIALAKSSDDNVAGLLDPGHFGNVVRWNHAAVFADAFTEIDVILSKFREMAAIRNDWAHISPDALSPRRVAASIQAMREILVALRCREALEIDTLMAERNINQPDVPSLEPASTAMGSGELDDDDGSQIDEMAAVPLELWRALQSYLVAEAVVEEGPPTDRRGNVQEGQILVTVRVSNVAPASEDRPHICFQDVDLTVTGGRELEDRYRGNNVGTIEPGQTVERQFALYEKEVAQFEFQASGRVDVGRFFGTQQKGGLPAYIVRPILDDFRERFETIGIKEPLRRVMASLAIVQPAMTLAEAAQVRQELEQVPPLIAEKRAGLNDLFREFHLNREAPLGAQCREVGIYLQELGEKIQTVDDAIGTTNVEAIQQAVSGVEQLQLSVLQVEETIRKMLTA